MTIMLLRVSEHRLVEVKRDQITIVALLCMFVESKHALQLCLIDGSANTTVAIILHDHLELSMRLTT